MSVLSAGADVGGVPDRRSRREGRHGRRRPGASSIAADRDSIWIAIKSQFRVVRLDARTGRIEREISTDFGPTLVAAGSTGLWIATQEGPTTPATLLHYSRDGSTPRPPWPIESGVADMVHGGGALWLAVERTSSIRRYDRDDWEGIGNAPSAASNLAYGANALWVVAGGDTITRIRPRTERLRTKELPSLPGEIGVSGDLVVVALRARRHLLVLDARTMNRKGPPVPVRRNPLGIATHAGDVWVTGLTTRSHGSAEQLAVDGAPGKGRSVLGGPSALGYTWVMGVLAPGAVVGGCRIEGVVGKGGMGVVYLARQLELDRDVALKVISPELTEDAPARARFLAEARAAAAVEHPNVVPVHAVGTHEDRAYLVMRFIRGDDLRALVRREGPLPPMRAAAIAERLGDALDAIHRAGYVHRDVKPPNVLIDDEDNVYLSDFGLAKAALATRGPTSEDHWVGTLDYVAPEQIRGEPVDPRTDVYALGGVLHFMLTGRPPFAHEADEAKLWAHLHEDPPRPSEHASVPLGFDAVVVRALAKDKADRQDSAGELGRAALAAARGEDVAAPTATARTVHIPVAAPTATARTLPTRVRRRAPVPWAWLAGLVFAAAGGALFALALSDDDAGPTTAATVTPGPDATATPESRPALELVRSYPNVGESPDGLAVVGRDVWVISDERTQPVWFDLARDSRPEVPEIGPGAVSIAADGDAVWIALKPQNRVVRINARTGAIEQMIPTTFPPTRVAAGTTGLWIATQEGPNTPATLLHFTRDGLTPLTPRVIDNGIADMVHGGDAMWLAVAQTAAIRRYDENSARVVEYTPARETNSLAYGDGAIWAVSGGDYADAIRRRRPEPGLADAAQPGGEGCDRRPACLRRAADRVARARARPTRDQAPRRAGARAARPVRDRHAGAPCLGHGPGEGHAHALEVVSPCCDDPRAGVGSGGAKVGEPAQVHARRAEDAARRRTSRSSRSWCTATVTARSGCSCSTRAARPWRSAASPRARSR